MIWVDGRVVPDDALRVSVQDRTFRHGLGLFETLRTWNGRAPLLPRHLERLTNSASCLGLTLPDELPDRGAVEKLLVAEGRTEDVVLRITTSGGLEGSGRSTLWMRTLPLHPPPRPAGAVVDVGPWKVVEGDPLARHKSLNYWARSMAHDRARADGFDEVLSLSDAGRVWEGSRTNLFVVAGSRLITPSLEGPIVPGVMRGLVIELARDLNVDLRETMDLDRRTADEADEVFLTNSVRGVIPVMRLDTRSWPVPGALTQRLAARVADRLAGA